MSIKLLINGIAGAGKTDLLGTLGKESFVVSRDAKKFMLPIPHMLVDKWYDMSTFLYGGEHKNEDGAKEYVPGVYDKLMVYADKMGQPPENVAIDSVSQIWMDVIDKASLTPNVYGSQGAEVTKEMGLFVKFVHEVLELNGINVILLNHVIEEKVDGKPTGSYVPFGSGKFKEKGAFYATVNEAVTVVPQGTNRYVYTRNDDKQARTTLKDIPDKVWIENNVHPEKSKKLQAGEEYFTLKGHLDKLLSTQVQVDDYRM